MPKALLPEGNGRDVLLTGIAKRAGVCACALCVVHASHLRGGWVRPCARWSLFKATLGTPCSSACWCHCSSRKAHTMVPLGPAEALHTVSLPCGSGQWNSCISLLRCPGAVSSGSAACCLIALGHRAVDLLQVHRRTVSGLRAVDLLQIHRHTAWGSGQWNSCSGQWNSCCPLPHCHTAAPLPHCLGVVGNGAPAMHRHTTWGQWAVELLKHTAALPRGRGQWNSCATLPHCLGAMEEEEEEEEEEERLPRSHGR